MLTKCLFLVDVFVFVDQYSHNTNDLKCLQTFCPHNFIQNNNNNENITQKFKSVEIPERTKEIGLQILCGKIRCFQK